MGCGLIGQQTGRPYRADLFGGQQHRGLRRQHGMFAAREMGQRRAAEGITGSGRIKIVGGLARYVRHMIALNDQCAAFRQSNEDDLAGPRLNLIRATE